MPKLYAYLHTHWDREWYLPFEGFRCRLVEVVRSVLDGLENGSLPSFYLDGQAIALEDAVELVPGLEPRLKHSIAQGKLSAGPWYVLADQMLVCGESLIANLKIGMAACRRFGQPAGIGYCPDTFGHSQDLPRILAGFGLKNAVVWRGVPALPEGPAFKWSSPDGSSVLAYHLTHGYCQMLFHENLKAETRAESLLAWLSPCLDKNEASPFLPAADGALFPVGGDHAMPPAAITDKVAEISKSWQATGKHQIIVAALADFLAHVEQAVASSSDHIHKLTGELRDNTSACRHGNGYLLPGVLSSRLYLKRSNRLAEHRLIKINQPLYTLLALSGAMSYPDAELNYAWKLLLKNHPHDSICGCSVDAVHDEMQTRTMRLNSLLDGLDARAEQAIAGSRHESVSQSLEALSPRDPDSRLNCLVAFNLSAGAACGPVRVTWASHPDNPPPAAAADFQLIESRPAEELFGGGELPLYYKNVRLNEGWVFIESTGGLSCRQSTWPPQAADMEGEVAAGQGWIDNGLIRLEADSSGSLSAICATGAQTSNYKIGHRLVDVGDGGDTYNFDPLPDESPFVASVKEVKAGQKGPLVGSLVITCEIDIPVSLDAAGVEGHAPPAVRTVETCKHVISTEVSLRKGVPIVFFETVWENRSRDHRLEAVFDTGAPVKITYSENHFSLVARKHTEARSPLPVAPRMEAIPDRFPCQRFFVANDQIFFNFGLPEYAVDGNSVSITLLRAVSILSRGPLRSRGGGAGPHLSVPAANCLGINRTSYGWAPLAAAVSNQAGLEASSAAGMQAGSAASQALSDSNIVKAYDLCEQFEGKIKAFVAPGYIKPGSRTFFHLDNPAIRLSSLYFGGEHDIFLRLLNVTGQPQPLRLDLGFRCQSAFRCSLDEKHVQKLPVTETSESSAGNVCSIPVSFGINELVTLAFNIPEQLQ